MVCKLRKSLHGLKQSPRCWNKALREYVEKIGFIQTSGDPCIYDRRGETLAIIAIYVDDLIILAGNASEMQKIKEILKVQFNMKDMGNCSIVSESVSFKIKKTTKSGFTTNTTFKRWLKISTIKSQNGRYTC